MHLETQRRPTVIAWRAREKHHIGLFSERRAGPGAGGADYSAAPGPVIGRGASGATVYRMH